MRSPGLLVMAAVVDVGAETRPLRLPSALLEASRASLTEGRGVEAAGVAGGMVRALLAGGGWLAAMSSVVVGSLTAGYLTTPVFAGAKAWFPVIAADASSEHAIGFLVGLTAMLICEGVLRAARSWSKNPKLPQQG